MEPIGAAASLITLISLSKEIATKSRNVIRRYRNSSQALSLVRQHMLQLETQLFLLRDVQDFFAHTKIHGEKETLALRDTLAQTHSTFLSVREFLSQHTEKTGSRARLQWAIRDEARVRQWVDDLQQLTHSLNSIILMLNMLVYRACCAFGCLLIILSRLATDARVMADAFQADITTAIRARFTQSRRQRKELRYSPSNSHYYERLTRYSSTSSNAKEGEVCGISTSPSSIIRLWIMFKSLCENVSGLLLYKEVPNRNQIIAESSEIFAACKAGNTMAVLTLLEARKASPFDRTPKNSTPLRVIFRYFSEFFC
jgi:hypothetical protein